METLRLSHATVRYEIRRRGPWILLARVAGVVMVLVGKTSKRPSRKGSSWRCFCR